jgi:nucleoside-diphosphate kinase
MLSQLIAGPLIAMEVRGGKGPDTLTQFREFVGPSDPALAKQIRPNSIRAKYGEDKVKNAVHCTDLPEDGVLEVSIVLKSYLFF